MIYERLPLGKKFYLASILTTSSNRRRTLVAITCCFSENSVTPSLNADISQMFMASRASCVYTKTNRCGQAFWKRRWNRAIGDCLFAYQHFRGKS